ncbi:Putative sugar phosphate transporter domain-containing protein [Septoria linicola]|uniref:Sugar phosphate transporter domain-containing protein n=1 Tax=Septoria linicola TaxID=215465 RepID=A0A9Q9AUK3_9PEZI|nr:putative sugar phosphate transporter domain-containing protein [Septoria linicola]USW52272.1 Putative sugar phosphate transporter domain-containing protein [Septoria linicola]
MSSSYPDANQEKTLLVDEQQQKPPQWEASDNLKSRFVDGLWVALNTIATIVIVFMNNTLSDPQLRKSQVLIATWHFAATFLVLLLAATYRRWRLFEAVRIPIVKILPLSAFFAGFLILNNLSLANNPVGFYQLSKILTTPSVVFINFLLFRKYIARDKLVAVLITCVGLGLVSVESFKSNLAGTVIAGAAFTTTACYQIWIGKKIVDLGIDAPQLLLNQSATAVWLLIPVSLAFDVFPDFGTIPRQTLGFLFGGGIVASFLNLSQFMIIGRTSALTFNIVSNVKMLAILALGWYSEGKVFTALDIVGIVLALVGAWQYARKS